MNYSQSYPQFAQVYKQILQLGYKCIHKIKEVLQRYDK